MIKYAVIYGQTGTGWSAFVPDLPGLIATGATFAEVEQLMREGLDFHLESMLEDGDAIPEPSTRVGVLETGIIEGYRARFAKSA